MTNKMKTTRYAEITVGDWYQGDQVISVGPQYSYAGAMFADVVTKDEFTGREKTHSVITHEPARA